MAQVAELPSIRVDLTGELRRADLDLGNFSVRLADGRQATGGIQIAWESLILEALKSHDSQQLHIIGFCTNDNLQNIDLTSIESVELSKSEPLPQEAQKPFWQRVIELTADIPDSEWAKIPTDLAETHKRRSQSSTDPR